MDPKPAADASADPARLYAALAGALRERLAVIADRGLYMRDPAAHLAQLQAAAEKIDHLQAQVPSDADPQLRHYLERSSFDKALALLEGLPRR